MPSGKERRAKYRKDRKAAIFALLGDKCNRCGFVDKRALQIDHINGDGRADRKLDYYNSFLNRVFANPDRYQILCANCNWIKRAENNELGTCK